MWTDDRKKIIKSLDLKADQFFNSCTNEQEMCFGPQGRFANNSRLQAQKQHPAQFLSLSKK